MFEKLTYNPEPDTEGVFQLKLRSALSPTPEYSRFLDILAPSLTKLYEEKMTKPKFTPKKLSRVMATTRFINGVNKLLYMAAAGAFGLLIIATAVPQKRKFDEIQAKLEEIREREEEVLEVKENREIELYALRQDQAYLEVQARDRLNYYREGEIILRFERDR